MIVGRMTLLSLLHPLLLLLLTMTTASTAASTTTTKSISSLLLRHQQRTIIFDQKNFNHSLPLKNHSANNASSTNTTFAAAAAAAAVHLLGKDGQQSTGMFTQEQTHFHTISNKWEDALKLVNIFFFPFFFPSFFPCFFSLVVIYCFPPSPCAHIFVLLAFFLSPHTGPSRCPCNSSSSSSSNIVIVERHDGDRRYDERISIRVWFKKN